MRFIVLPVPWLFRHSRLGWQRPRETRIVTNVLKGCQFVVVRLQAVMVDSPPFDRALLRPSQFSTPVEIAGFQQDVSVTRCEIMRSSMAKVVGPEADTGFPVGFEWYGAVVDFPQAKVQTRQSGG